MRGGPRPRADSPTSALGLCIAHRCPARQDAPTLTGVLRDVSVQSLSPVIPAAIPSAKTGQLRAATSLSVGAVMTSRGLQRQPGEHPLCPVQAGSLR